ncbi:DUF6531 domain-containing protein [Streptomyces olivaceoviridis]
MGYTIPGWLDEILDVIGVNFPNVDEDDYREMATSMREFAENFEGKGGDAHQAVSRILSSSRGWAVDAMEKHWSHVKAGHLDKIPELARLFADACDVVADVIYGMKIKAEIELGAMAASVGISLGLAAFTGGLSALLGAAEITAMRQAVKRIVDEAADQIVDELVARVTEPVNAKLEKMVEDAVLDLAEGAFSLPPEPTTGGGGDGGGGSGQHGHGGGMRLASAGGAMTLASAGGGSGGDLHVDHVEFEDGADKVSRHGSDLHTAVTDPLERAKGHFGRTKGKDAFTAPFESVLEGALKGSEKAVKKIVKHLSETVPDRVKATSRLHKGIDIDVGRRADGIHVNSGKPGGGSDHHGAPASGRKPDPGLKIDSADLSRQGRELNAKQLCGDPIDMATGQMALAQTDVALPGVLPLILRRTHLSGYRAGRFFGPSWASTLDERIQQDDALGGYWWHREDGSALAYPRLPDLPGDRVGPAEGVRLPLTYVSRGSGYVLTVEDPYSGLTRQFEAGTARGGPWWLVGIEDRNGNHLSVERDDDGVPLTVTHGGGYRIRVDHDDQRRVTALWALTDDDPVRLRAFGYDAATGNLSEVRNAVDAPTRFTYDGARRVTGWRDSNDTEFTYVYDAEGRVIETRGTDGILNSRLSYGERQDDGTSTAAYTDSLGNTTVYRANRHGQIVAITDPLGHTVTQTWDRHDHLLSRTDPLGRTTRWTWDDAGDLVSVTAPDGTSSHVAYDTSHRPVRITDPQGATYVQDFDARGNRTALTAPDGSVHRFTHHATGAVATVSGPAGDTLRIDTDPAGLATALEDAQGNRTRYLRDAFGRPVRITDPLGATTTLVWDAEGRLRERTAANGATESWTYDGEGNCTSHTDPVEGRTRLVHGPFDLLAARISPNGVEHRFRYDTERRLTEVLDPQGLVWRYVYDAAGQLVKETDFDGYETTYRYDAAGDLTARTNAAGQTVGYHYDASGQLVEKVVDGRRTVFRNDACGRLVSAAGPDGTLAYAYDAVGRVIAETIDGRTLTTACDASGRRTLRRTPGGVETTYSYDTAGRYAELSLSGRTLSFEHDAAGREVLRHLGDRFTLAFDWNPVGSLSGQTLTVHGTARPSIQRGYTYRHDGLLTGITDRDAGRRSFLLDPAGRVTAVEAGRWSESYAYDERGNQTRATWPERHPGSQARGTRGYAGTRLVSAGNVRYEHDAAGRCVLRQVKRLSRKPDTWRYTWDAEDRLLSVVTPDGTCWRYLYDPLGRRMAKQRLTADGAIAEETRFVWDGSTLVEQTTRVGGAAELVTLTWDHDGQAPVAQTETKSLADAPQDVIDQRFFAIVTDQIGTPTELVDEEGGIAWRTRATLWGSTTWNQDATAYTPLRFPGQYYDPETGLHHNYFRHYDPETARYLTSDPLGLDPAPNPFAYVDNPHTLSDPLGLTPCDENDVTWGGRVRYGAPGPGGRATTMRATIESDMTGGKTDPRVNVPGYQKYKKLNKTHLLGAQIGGSNRDPRNFVTMHRFANSPVMRKIEDQIREAVDKRGETIEYTVTPVYRTNDPTDVIPLGLTIEARGNKGFAFTPYEGGGSTNIITILNVPKRI